MWGGPSSRSTGNRQDKEVAATTRRGGVWPACVLLQRGEFSEATRLLRRILSKREILGGLEEPSLALLICAYYLGGASQMT